MQGMETSQKWSFSSMSGNGVKWTCKNTPLKMSHQQCRTPHAHMPFIQTQETVTDGHRKRVLVPISWYLRIITHVMKDCRNCFKRKVVLVTQHSQQAEASLTRIVVVSVEVLYTWPCPCTLQGEGSACTMQSCMYVHTVCMYNVRTSSTEYAILSCCFIISFPLFTT